MGKMAISSSALVLAAVALVSSEGQAQTLQYPAMNVGIDGAGESGAAACGISEDRIRSAIMSAMRYNRVPYREQGKIGDPYIYVQINTLNDRRGCVTSYNVSVNQTMLGDLQTFGKTIGSLEYCSKGGILSGTDHESRLLAALKQRFDDCLADMTKYRLPDQ